MYYNYVLGRGFDRLQLSPFTKQVLFMCTVVPVASLNAQPRMASIISAPPDNRIGDVRTAVRNIPSPTQHTITAGPRGKCFMLDMAKSGVLKFYEMRW